MQKLNIAIDGPAGSGKSTLTKWIAKQYGYQLVDTGAMYRSIAYLALKRGIDLTNETKLREICSGIRFSFKMGSDTRNQVIVNGEDLTDLIRSPEVSLATSDISKLKPVREAMVSLQQALAKDKGVVMEGRDIGSVVLLDADVKFFMTASIEERAKRRLKDFEKAGTKISLSELIDKIKKRDEQDASREHSPLLQAKDAILIDTSDLTIQDVFEMMKKVIDKKLKVSS